MAKEFYIDPWHPREYEGITLSARRLEKVAGLLEGADISDLLPLERFALERAIGRFVSFGFIGSPIDLESTLMQSDPPERMYINSDVERINDISRILKSLEKKGFLVLDLITEKYSLGTQPTNKQE